MPQKWVSACTAAANTGARTTARVSESAAASGTLTIANPATPTPNASATSAPTATGRARVDDMAAARLDHHLGVRQSVGNLEAPRYSPPGRTLADMGQDDGAGAWSREEDLAMDAWLESSADGDTVDEVISEFLDAARSG